MNITYNLTITDNLPTNAKLLSIFRKQCHRVQKDSVGHLHGHVTLGSGRCLKKDLLLTNSNVWLSFGLFLCLCYMVFNATFNNISVISWRLV
jgi:hypothetical protein